MPVLRYEHHTLERLDAESVLDTLLRAGVPVPYSCKSGVCGSCMLRAVEGPVPERAQAGLKDSWKARGYFLACSCSPSSDLTVSEIGAEARVPATIAAFHPLSHDVLRVDLRCDQPFEYRAGQYITLVREDGLSRSYSIASLPGERALELHVRRIPNGRMSGWLFDESPVGAHVRILGPSGDCFYVSGKEQQPMLLIGTGTGLAPLYGILRDAIGLGHQGPIHLFHGAMRPEGLYLREELESLARQNVNVTYIPTLEPIDQTVLKQFPKLAGFRAYLCGDPAIVQSLKKKLFLAGMALRDIQADAFLPSVA